MIDIDIKNGFLCSINPKTIQPIYTTIHLTKNINKVKSIGTNSGHSHGSTIS